MKIAVDKVLHLLFNLTAVIVIGVYEPLLGVIVALSFSFGKEGYDYKVKGTASIGDLIADGLGICFGVVVLILLEVI